jgi:hypothetical protein
LILSHDTNAEGLRGIRASGWIRASTGARNPRDVRYGDGQYFSDIPPGSKNLARLSRIFLGFPFFGDRFTHYVAIEIDGREWFEGRPGVFVIPNDRPLDISGRVVSSGLVPVLDSP